MGRELKRVPTKAMTAKRLGKPYRAPGGRYQTYIVTFDDGSETLEEIPLTFGRQSAREAKARAEAKRLAN